jgi:hypothetical protein
MRERFSKEHSTFNIQHSTLNERREKCKKLFEKALAMLRLRFGVPPLGGVRALPPKGGTPNQGFQTRSNWMFDVECWLLDVFPSPI